MTRTVRDAALLMNVLTGADVRDFMSLPPQSLDYRTAVDGLSPKSLRIGLLLDMKTGLQVDAEVRAATEAAAEAHAIYADLVEQATDRTPDSDEIAAMSAYEMAATVEFGLEAKQGLLDLRSETARLRLVTRLFRGAIKRLDFVERAQARARSNGKVHFGD